MKISIAIRTVFVVALVAVLALSVFANTVKTVSAHRAVNLPVINASGGPDGYGYIWRDNNNEPTGPTYSWVDMSAGTRATWAYFSQADTNDDALTTPVTIPFNFSIYGSARNRLVISSNGFITFDTTYIDPSASYQNVAIPAATTPNLFIAPFWCDLVSSNVRYGSSGGNFVVEWVATHGWNAPADSTSFEVILNPNGSILFQYLSMSSNLTAGSTIGIENGVGAIGLQVAFDAAYPIAGRAVSITLPTATNFVYGNVTAATGGAMLDSVLVTLGTRTTYTTTGYYRIQSLTGMQHLSFTKPGWNSAADSVNVASDSAQLNKTMTHPIVGVLPTSLELNVTAPDSITGTITASNTGDGSAGYGAAATFTATPMTFLRQVTIDSFTMEGINFGADYFNGYFYMPAGNHFQRFNLDFTWHDSSLTIQGAAGGTFTIRDLCDDGQYLYGSWDRTLRAFDATTGNNVAAGNISLANVGTATNFPLARGVAYDPNEDAFYVSNWVADTVYKINRSGAVLKSYGGHTGVGGMTWHPEDPDGYNLWLFQPGTIPMYVTKMNVTTGAVLTVANPLPHAQADDYSSAGCFLSDQIIPGTWVFGAVIQGTSMDRLSLFSCGDAHRWSLTPSSGTINPAGQAVFTVKYRTRASDVTGTAQANFRLSLSTGNVITVPVTINEVVSAPEARNVNPTVFALQGAYPNPFNPTTTVKFSLATYSKVSLVLYDINGRKVADILNAELPAGHHAISFKATDLASGTYFVKMNSGKFNAVSKIVFLK